MKMMEVISKENISVVKYKVNENENENRKQINNVDYYYNHNVTIFVLAFVIKLPNDKFLALSNE